MTINNPDYVETLLERMTVALETIAAHLTPVHITGDAFPDLNNIVTGVKPADDADWVEWDGSLYVDKPDDELFTPVPRGTLLDIRTRNGKIFTRLPAGKLGPESVDAAGAFWRNDETYNDIVAYRLSK